MNYAGKRKSLVLGGWLSVWVASAMLGCGGGSSQSGSPGTPVAPVAPGISSPSISSFTSSANPIFPGESSTLTPVFINGIGSIDHGVGTVASGTAYSVAPSADSTYTLTVVNSAGASATAQLTIQVDTTSPIISSFSASPSQVSYGETSTLSWSLVSRVTSVMLDGVSVLGESARTVSPVRRQTYVLAASNPLGRNTRSVTIAARGLDLLAGHLGGPGSADGTGPAAGFNTPFGVAVDGSGNVYVADADNHTIRKITPAGVVSTLAGLPGISGSADGTGIGARFNAPFGVAVDGSGNVYVADAGNHTIRKITPAGAVSTLAGLAGTVGSADGTGPAARFYYPRGVAVDGSGNVYVGDQSNHTLRKVTPAGVVSTLAGLAGTSGSADGTGPAARFYSPWGTAVDNSGNVYVTDFGNHTLRKVTPAGVVTTLAGLAGTSGSADGTGPAARFYYPRGVTVDSSGNIYVADTFNHTIRKVTPARVVSTLAGLAGTDGSADGTGSAARFRRPSGAAVDRSGNVYVADSFNHTIREIMPGGVVSTLAGLAGISGSADGTGPAARFSSPDGAAVDRSANVYIADAANHTIRKITAAGVVSTLAGLAGTSGSTDGIGGAARFNFPYSVAVDGSGNAYVADSANHTIRKITAAGVVSTLAGSAGTSGSIDGTGPGARFAYPSGVAVDSSGNVYVADTGNVTIRKVTAAGVVSTLAGLPGAFGSADGTGPAARFQSPTGVAVDGSGNIYVADTDNNTIRKVTAAAAVTTLAGLADTRGSADGIGPAARFNFPNSVAVDSSGNVYVADTGNHTIRRVTAASVVSTLAGSAGRMGVVPGPLPTTLSSPQGIALTPAGDLIVSTLNGVVQITAF